MKRYKHSLSHYRLLTGDMGQLLPVGAVEVLPGDTFQHSAQMLIRATPLSAPVMHPVVARLHHWYVPYRTLDSALSFDWAEFITGGADGDDTSTVPKTTQTVAANSPADYLGVPPGTNRTYNKLMIAAYFRIWNTRYRDQDIDAVKSESDSGSDAADIQRVAWEKDYFTRSRPWAQKGTAVTIPLGTTADVISDGTGIPTFLGGGSGSPQALDNDASDNVSLTGGATGDLEWSNPNLVADLSTATGLSPNDLREYFALQRFQEARARYGSRFTEYLRYLGVHSSDRRLQEPEYLGGGRSLLQFSEVVQTAPETDQTSPTEYGTGDLYGHGIAAVGGRPYRRFFEEHGVVMSLLSVRPKAMYVNGLPKVWSKQDKEDYFQTELAHIGQQEILNQEVYVDDSGPTDVFGYGDRYREYREQPSQVAGEFRTTLNYWHLGRIFSGDVALNSSFLACNPSKRIFNEQSAHSLWIMVNHKIKARRIVPRAADGRLR